MWARLESNTIKETLRRPKALTIGGAQYPSNIFSTWTDSELAVIGIVPITMDYTNQKDLKYYINTEVTYTYDAETKKATGSYGTATARPLTGLKSQHKIEINLQAGSLLQPTDWMVIREADGGTSIPSNIKTFRTAVRTKANTHCTSIDNVASVDALAALTFDWPEQP